MKNVLIALDVDAAAKKVALTGYDVATAMKAELSLLHVIVEPTYYSSLKYSPIMGYDTFNGMDAVVETENLSELLGQAGIFLDKMKFFLGDDKVRTIIKTGSFWEKIVETANELKADFIVMGTHNRHGIEKMLSGSIAEKVLHHSTIPVLIVPVKE